MEVDYGSGENVGVGPGNLFRFRRTEFEGQEAKEEGDSKAELQKQRYKDLGLR